MKKYFLGLLLLINFLLVQQAFAITNGSNAVDLIGQYDDVGATIVNYTTNSANNGAGAVNALGLSNPVGLFVDTTNHRLFLGDRTNNRVLVFNLNASNELIDKTADNVLGQANFTSNASATTQAGMNAPNEFAFDSARNYLFVADQNNNRVLVYDVATITNGENAIYVLGQTNFTTSSTALTQSGMNTPWGLAYDNTNNQLFVADAVNHRVLMYDVDTITNGENAIYVLGQPDFTTDTITTTQVGLGTLRGLAYDVDNKHLFVADLNGNRVVVYDVSSITNGENAISVLGQPDFTTTTAATTQAGMSGPRDIFYDDINNRLFTADSVNNRVLIYDTSTITNGEDAVYVLGQPNFTSNASAITQSGMNFPTLVFYDDTSGKLFVVEFFNQRVTIYDLGFPRVSVFTPSNVTTNSSVIIWNTNESSSSIIEYGTTNSYGTSTIETDTSPRVTSHSVNLSNLTECTTYHYRAKSNDTYFNLGISLDNTFTTPGCSAVPISILQFQSDAGRLQQNNNIDMVVTPSISTNNNTTAKFIFTKNLQYKDNNTDVRELQKFLNGNGFPVSLIGVGSKDHETNYFGLATRAALIKFQIANSINPAVGYFGSITRGVVNK